MPVRQETANTINQSTLLETKATSVFSLGVDGRCSGTIIPVSLCGPAVAMTSWKRLHGVTTGKTTNNDDGGLNIVCFFKCSVIYRWEPAPPELMLSASLVAAEASDRLEPDWALLRLSAV